MSGSLDQANDQDVHELVGYLESNDINVVAQVKQVIHENLYAAKDSGVVNALADCYVQTKSDHLLEILVGVNDVQAQVIFMTSHFNGIHYTNFKRLMLKYF